MPTDTEPGREPSGRDRMPVAAPVTGVAAGVPYAAWPPEPDGDRGPAFVLWHGFDPPRTPAAMAAALPLHGLPVWRIYLCLPMFGDRGPGDPEEVQRLAAEDFLLKLYAPIVQQAVAELPAVLEALQEELPINPGPIGLGGFSAGGAATLLTLAASPVPVAAAAVINGVPNAANLVALGEQFFGVTYSWTEESRAKAAELDFIARAAEVARRKPQPPVLFTAGGDDPLTEDIRAAHAAVQRHYPVPEQVSFHYLPGLGHAFVPEPGMGPAPQSPESVKVDAAVKGWLERHALAPTSR